MKLNARNDFQLTTSTLTANQFKIADISNTSQVYEFDQTLISYMGLARARLTGPRGGWIRGIMRILYYPNRKHD